MKVRVSFTVDIDADAWADEFGCDRADVRRDVQDYFSNQGWQGTYDQYPHLFNS